MHPATYRAFLDEVEKIGQEKVAVDPITMAGLGAAGKIMATNALHRFGHKLPPVKWLAKEVAGVGARTAMQGKPMMSAPIRHALAIGVDPKLTSLYEHAHQIAQNAGKQGIGNLQALRSNLVNHPVVQGIPALSQAADVAKDIPLESKGLRKVVDYGFTPVSQVGQDIKNVAGRAASGVGSALKKMNPMKLLKKAPRPA